MKYFICSKCGKKKLTKPQRYKKILNEYGGNRDLLKANYICQDCKFKAAKRWVTKKFIPRPVPTQDIEHTEPYKKLVHDLTVGAFTLHHNGIQHKECRDIFYYDVKQLLASHNIVDFSINILDNKVVSITIRGIPFLGTHDINLKEQYDKNNRV